MGGNSGGGGNGGRSGGGGSPLDQELSALQTEASTLRAKEKMLWETSKTHISKEENKRLEQINPRIHDLEIMKNNPTLGKQIVSEGNRAKALRDTKYIPKKLTTSEKRRQWEMDHPL